MGHTLRKLLAAIMVACFSITFLAGCGDTPEEKAQKQAEQQAKAQKKAQEEAEKQAKIEAEKAAKEAAEEAEKKAEEEAAAREAAKTPEERAAEDGVSAPFLWFYGTDRYNAYIDTDYFMSNKHIPSKAVILEVDKKTKKCTYSGLSFLLASSAKIKTNEDYLVPKNWYYGRYTFAINPSDPKFSPYDTKRVNSIALEAPDPKAAQPAEKSEEITALINQFFPPVIARMDELFQGVNIRKTSLGLLRGTFHFLCDCMNR